MVFDMIFAALMSVGFLMYLFVSYLSPPIFAVVVICYFMNGVNV